MKLLLLFLLILLSTTCSFAQGSSIYGQAIASTGMPAAYATIRVCPSTGAGTPCSPLSSLYSDPALTQSIANPYTADNLGNYGFFVTAGAYYLVQLNVGGTYYSYLVSAAGTGSGSVTSVGLSLPSIITVTGSPVTTSGTLTGTLASQTANTVFAAPNGSSGTPTFRALTTSDLPSGLGTVTNVGLTAPSSVFTVSGSPVTGSGSLALGLQTQAAHNVWAGPTSGTATPIFRQLSYSDLSGTPPTGYYQTFSFNGTAAAQAAIANFSPLFTFGNVSGQTNIGLNTTGSQTTVATAGAAGVSGNCASWNALGGIGDAGVPCGGGASTINSSPQYSAGYYSASGSASYISGILPPTTTGTFVYAWRPSGSAVAPVATQLTADDILPGFSISGFVFNSVTCTTCELGWTVNSPVTFIALYSATPVSASIGDGTNTVALTTPFTSGSMPYSYTSSSISTTTFTLTAASTSTKTATLGIQWQPRTFAGLGSAAGATGATASGSNASLVGATGTLMDQGLGSTYAGQMFSLSPSSQYIYLLLTGGCGHAISVNGFGTVFTTTAISFTNQYSASVSMCLYQSPSYYSGTYAVEVTSL